MGSTSHHIETDTSSISEREQRRLRALHRLGEGALKRDPRFDRLTKLAAQATGAPIAMVTLVAEDMVHHKSATGIKPIPMNRKFSICSVAIEQDETLVIEDLTKDARFQEYPRVVGEPHYRFYAGVVLRDKDGLALGTLCVMDIQPRVIDQDKIGMLRNIADMVEEELVPSIEVGQRRAAAQMAAERDALTSFLSARAFTIQSDEMMSLARVTDRKVDMIAVKIHDLNAFNRRDRLLSGDVVLIEMSHRFNEQLAGYDYEIGRCHANGVNAAIADIGDLDELIGRLISDLGEPINTAYGEIEPTVQIAVVPDAHMVGSPRELAKTLDHLFGECPIVPGAHVKVFGNIERGKVERSKFISQRLKRAMDERLLDVHYQPKVRSSTGKVEGMEALMRWTDDELGFIAPNEVVDAAEEFGLAVELDVYILDRVCQNLKSWKDAGCEVTPVSVNISSDHLQMPEFPKKVQGVVETHGVAPSLLDIEILENVVVNDVGAVIDNMKHLRELGVTFSIDDFGTGYSSLSYLMELPLDTLKIDRAFIQNIIDSPKAAALAQAIITIGHEGGMKVVAEGVEDLAQFLVIRAYRCDLVQGYFFSKAISSDDMLRLMSGGGVIAPPDMNNISA